MGGKADYSTWTKDELLEEVQILKQRKKYGLVWEDKPEDVVEQCKRELPVLDEKTDRAIELDPLLPVNYIIEGDNYHALSVLNYTHPGSIDVIYIDPPYNTGNNSWRYNNDYLDPNDPYRHSKWLSMMERRLRLSRDLLKYDGIIAVTIDDYEVFTLGLLMDSIFGEEQRMGVVAIEVNPRGRTINQHFATSHEYILFYGRSSSAKIFDLSLTDEQVENFKHADDKSRYRLLPFRRSGGLSTPADRPNSEFFLGYSRDMDRIISVGGQRTTDPSDPYKTSEVVVIKGGSIQKISITDYRREHPDVVNIFPLDTSGKRRVWRWSDREKILLASLEGDFVVKERAGKYDVLLKDRIKIGRKPKTVWVDAKYDASTHGTNLLKKMFGGEKVFDYPKSIHSVVQTLLVTRASNKKAVVLDFFAGSGTTGHAVLELNRTDGGERSFILCTNNENKIAEEVTYPRVKKAIEGYSDLGGIPANVRYFSTAFVPRSEVSDDTRRDLVKRSTQMLCIKESTFKKLYDNQQYKLYEGRGQVTGILFDLDAIDDFKKKLEKLGKQANVYVFSISSDSFDEDFADLKIAHRMCAIPESILEVYRKVFP